MECNMEFVLVFAKIFCTVVDICNLLHDLETIFQDQGLHLRQLLIASFLKYE